MKLPLKRRSTVAYSLLLLLACATAASGQATVISIGTETLRTSVQRFGINLSGQNFYDSGQTLLNLVSRNPGFEGETWQTILHCKLATRTSCTDENQYTVWPANFVQGARYQVLSGTATGATGTVLSSSTAHPPQGISLTLSPMKTAPAAGDFLLIRIDKPGGADAGWWNSTKGGATISTEFKDLSPHTPGKQALRIEASGAGQSAFVNSYFDTLAGHSFVQMHGLYRLQFRAKPIAGNNRMGVRFERLDMAHGLSTFLSKTMTLGPGWHDYAIDIPMNERGSAVGNVGLTFTFNGASALLDDVSLGSATHSPANPTAFRDEVVQTLRDLRPGVLRYMDGGASFGSSLDNLLAPPFARNRSGESTQTTLSEDLPIGLGDF